MSSLSIVLALVLSSLMVFPISETVEASGEGWLEGWDYRNEITFTGSTSDSVVNYPINLQLYNYEYFDFTNQTNVELTEENGGGSQGVTVYGDYIYTTNSTHITKWEKDGTLIATHDADGEGDGTAEYKFGDLCYYDSHLYASWNNGVNTGEILEYDTSLSYIDNITLDDPLATHGAGAISYHDGFFWVLWDCQSDGADDYIDKYSTSWVKQARYALTYDVFDYWHYQGLTWFGDYVLLPNHESTTPFSMDVYYFNGSGFEEVYRYDIFNATIGATYYLASQGLQVEYHTGEWYIWLTTRNFDEEPTQILRYNIGNATNSENMIFLGGNAQDDYDDIRFTDSDGSTELDYWIENYYANDGYASVWVEVPSIGVSPNTATVYLYYGNSTCSTTSDLSAVAKQYDDFEYSGDVSAEGWTILTGSSPITSSDYAYHGSKSMKIDSSGGSGSTGDLTLDEATNRSLFWFYDRGTGTTTRLYHVTYNTSRASDPFSVGAKDSSSTTKYQWYDGSWHDTGVTRTNGWHKVEVFTYNDKLSIKLDNELVVENNSRYGWVSSIGWDLAVVATEIGYMDTMVSLNYINPEPYISDVGAIESLGFGNNPPSISSPNPANGSSGSSISIGSWSCTIEDTNGDTFNWTIEVSTGDSDSANDASNGTKSVILGDLEYHTEYTVWVNVTDGEGWTNETFTFETAMPFQDLIALLINLIGVMFIIMVISLLFISMKRN